MNQSQRVAQYISDNENDDDMELGSFNNSGIVKQKIKQNRRKWIPMCTYYDKDSAIYKIKTDKQYMFIQGDFPIKKKVFHSNKSL